MKKIKVLSGFTGLSLYLVFASSFLFLLLPVNTHAQSQENKGLPFITNYRYQDYNADGINWWATEDDKGVMYFANNLGILMYDGQTWELIKPIDNSETRCVVKGKDGKIYVGTSGDLGYVDADEKGKMKFFSLKNKLPEKYRQFAEVWECNRLDDKIIFRTVNNLFIWDGKNMKVIDSYENLHVGNVVHNNIYVRIWNRGLTVLKNDSFHVVPGGERFANERIYVMLPYDEQRMLIGTRTQGLFIYDGKQFTPFKTEADPYIINTSLYGGQVLPNGNFALNSFNDGMVIITKEGKLVQRINKAVGLQDNSVDHIFLDSRGMLWMSMFNGIAKLDLRSSLSFYDESTGLPAKTVFGTGMYNGTLYAGTNNGVFMLDNNTNRFSKVEGTGGQINSFLLKGDDYLVGAAEKGLLKLIGNKSYPVIPGNNYDFHVTQLIQSKIDSNIIYVLLREGIAVVRYSPGNSAGNRYTVESINKNLRVGFGGLLERKDGSLWIVEGGNGELNLVTPLRSAGKTDIANATIKKYNAQNGLPRRPVGPTLYNDKTYFVAGKDSVFVYDEKQDRFLRDTGNFLSKHLVDYADGTGIFVKDNMGRQWVNLGAGVMVIIPNADGSEKIIDAPFRELRKNYPVWNIMPTVDKNGKPVVWFSGREGIIRYDGNLEETADTKFNTIIRTITLNEDSVYFSGLTIPGKDHSFSSKWNNIRIQYAAPFFKLENETVFSTFLEGRDKNWSDWNKQSFREFGNLPAGKYTFRVKAKNIYDVESTEAVFTFSVSPPWYASWWAYVLYALIAGAIIYAIVRMRTKQLHEKHRQLEKVVDERTAQLSNRVDELAVINSVQDGLVREVKMMGIYELVGEKIREIFNAQVIDIATYDSATNLMQDHYAYEKGDRTLVGTFEPNGFRKHVVETGQTVLINEDLENKAIEYSGKVLHGEMPKSAVFIPMISSNKVTGMISLQNLDQENAFTDSQVSMLTTLANSMSVALESARRFDETHRLLKETEQRNAELAVINSVQDGLVREMDMQGIYELVGEKIREIFDAQVIDIVTYDRKTNMIEDRYAYEKGDRSLLPARPVKGFRKHVIETGEYLMFNDKAEQAVKDYDQEVLIGDAAKSSVFVPLISSNEVNGVISLQNLDHEHAFTESDVRLINTLANTMSIALESARLFDETKRLLKETEQRTAELGVINSVQDGLAKEMDIQGIYELVGEKIRNIFNAQVIDIVIYDKATNQIEDRYAFENGDRTLLAARELKGFRKHVIESAKPLVINKDVDKERPKYNQAVIKGEGARSLVMVPMMAGGEINGVISLQNLKQENAFPEADVKLLNTLANSMSVALENARLFDETNRLLNETEQRTAELAVINSVQEDLVREMNTQAIYELVGDRICKLFDTQTVIIRTFDHDTSLEHWQYAIEKGENIFSEPRAFNWANKELIKNKKSLFINENYAATAKKFGGAGVTKGFPPKSALFVPMIVGNVVKGSVSLQNVEKENAFNESDLRVVTTLSNSMSVALENARLFDESNKLLAEAKQRANELSTVNNISQALTSQLNLDDLINLVGEQLRQLFKANIVYLAILDEKTNIINFPYQYGDDIKPMKMGEGLTSKIILTGKPLLVNKDLDELTEQLGVEKLGIPAASYLGVPIPVGDEVIGVLSIQTTEMVNRFNEDDQRLLTTIAASVGIALRKAKLFDEVHVAKLEAEAARKNAERANDAKSSFLSTVSHELRTPLTSVLGFAKIIKKRLEDKVFPVIDKDDPKLQKTINQVSDNLDVVVSEGERLTHLINDVLDLAKIEAGKMEWNNEPVSVAEIAERAIAATTSLFAHNKLELKKNIATDLPDITGDRDKLIQVMVNLISNSVKFTPKGSVTCKVLQKDEEIIVSIADTGIGIAPEDHAAVFEQFKQVGDTLTDKPKGTGLGLPICMEIIEHHGGRIWLESELGKGSTFLFALPISKSTEPRAVHLNDLVKQLKVQVANSQLNLKDKAASLLVVDDDESIRSLLNQELSELGYLVDEARDGKEALVKVRANRPDLIILDIMMPEMNGFDVAAVLKNDPVTMDIPIIVLSIVQDKTRGFRIGVDRYLTKPIDTGLLFNEIGSLLEQGKSKKKVMVVDEDLGTVNTLTEVLKTKGYNVSESDGSALIADAIANQPDIIIINSVLSGKNDIVQTLRFEKGLENVLFFVYK
ncbi:MAG: GAF domain-containing protein [Ferruginibacter sp.]